MNFIEILKKRKFQVAVIDFVIIILAAFTAFFVSNSFDFVNIRAQLVIPETLIYAVLSVLCMYLFKTYNNSWKYLRIGEIMGNIGALVMSSGIYIVAANAIEKHQSTIYSLFLCLFSILAITFSRCIYGYIYMRVLKHESTWKEGTLIVGGGAATRELIQEMYTSQLCKYKPVVIVDDDPEKKNMLIASVPIAGSTQDIPELVKKYQIKNIIFAIPSCDAKNKKRILAICAEANCNIKVIPFVHEIIDVGNLLAQVKPINIDELLGRDVVLLENAEVGETVKGKVCMVTGGGGSIGSELSRQIAKNEPKTLIIVDIYENNAYDIQQELIRKYGDKLDLKVIIASVRDYAKMKLIFEKFHPQIVFHAAAHKHVPLMETTPEEAVKNNIFGTFNTASLAADFGVDKFVLVSTDKAVNPTNVMGATKRCCEMIIQYMAQCRSKTEFIAVRFGNVLGSNGSVIPLFEKQIAENRPVTVTHPEIIRYFMTIPEAVSLILQAATIARGGEIFVLDMGEPVKILTLAENLIRMHGKEPYSEVKIEFTGLRPGEKLYEELLMDEEGLRSTANSRIFVGQQIKVDAQEFLDKLKILKADADDNNAEKCIEDLMDIVPTFNHEERKVQVS